MAKEFVGQEYAAATNGKGLHQQSKSHRILERCAVSLSVVVTVISVAMIAFCLIFSICPVIGTSMMTTLNATGEDTDNAITCYFGNPDRGDIVIYKLYLQNTGYTDNAESRKEFPYHDKKGYYKLIIKRLIGLPGDVISMRYTNGNYYLYLNGERLDEEYLDPLVASTRASNYEKLWGVLNNFGVHYLYDWKAIAVDECTSQNTIDTHEDASLLMLTVPENYHFLMGDNRNGFNGGGPSWDSTALGPFSQNDFYSQCIDVVHHKVNVPQYLWEKFVYYICFGWAWQK